MDGTTSSFQEEASSRESFISPQAIDIYQSLNLSSNISAELKQQPLSSEEFLARLVEGKFYPEAISFLAHGLVKPLQLEWACACLSAEPPLQNHPLLLEIKSWVNESDDATRRRIGEEGTKIGFENPLGWLAMAVFCQGSITPEDTPETIPQPIVVPHMVAGSLILAAVQGNPQNIEEAYKVFIEKGKRGALTGKFKEG